MHIHLLESLGRTFPNTGKKNYRPCRGTISTCFSVGPSVNKTAKVQAFSLTLVPVSPYNLQLLGLFSASGWARGPDFFGSQKRKSEAGEAMPKRTYQPHNRRATKKHGFRAR